jgi:histidinol-phosphatase
MGEDFLSFGLSLAKKSRHLISVMKARGFHVERKLDNSLVTEVDREIEKVFREEITRNFPSHRIIGEEFGPKEGSSEYEWVIDPIDGTISFTHNIPLFGTIIALYKKNSPVIGIIDLPGLNKCYYAAKGLGTFCDGNKILLKEKSDANLEKSIVATGDLQQFEISGSMDDFQKLTSTGAMVRTIPDCFGHSLAITGAVGAMVDYSTNFWDFAATSLLMEEAGGAFVIKDKFSAPDGAIKYNIIFGNKTIVNQLMVLLNT